jgi:hypothetical protein
VQSGSAVLHVETAPASALVSLDGTIEGLTPLRLRHLPSGYYHVSVERSGFTAIDTLVYLDDDVPTSISLTLTASLNESEDPLPPARSSTSEPSTPPLASRAESPSPRRTFGTIVVRADPTGVPVQLNGRRVGVAPLELGDVSAGQHTLTFSLPGYETSTVRVDVGPGTRETVDVTLTPRTGTLAVVVRPWGSIYIDGVLRARETDVRFETKLPVGTHQVRVEHPNLGTDERTVEVQADRTISTVFDLN